MTKTVVYFLTSLPVFFLVLACHLIASEPMSAIDWLAEKINDPPEFLTTPNEKTYEFQNFNQ